MQRNLRTLLGTVLTLVVFSNSLPCQAEFTSFYHYGGNGEGYSNGTYPEKRPYVQPQFHQGWPATLPYQGQQFQGFQSSGQAPPVNRYDAYSANYETNGGQVNYMPEAFDTMAGHASDSSGCSECGSADGCGCGGGLLGLCESPQCGLRHFDVHAEFMYLKREKVSRFVEFSLNGLSGPTVLSTNDLDFEDAPGFRISFRYRFGFSDCLEASYFGTNHWSDSAQATSNNDNLYSIFSNFGAAPFGGFLQTDQASLHKISYASELHNVEFNYRRNWDCSGGVQYSCLVGVRYLNLDENFRHFTSVDQHIDPLTTLSRGPAQMNYDVRTYNNLVGVQVGGDAWGCVLPGVMIGAELKAGIYGNNATQNTTISATNLTTLEESVKGGDVAFVAEAGLMSVWQITNHWTLRGGYQCLLVEGVALAAENFNNEQPFVNPAPPRQNLFVNDNGQGFYHGFTAGLEWLW